MRSTKTHPEWRWQTRVHLLLLLFLFIYMRVFSWIFSSFSFSPGSSCYGWFPLKGEWVKNLCSSSLLIIWKMKTLAGFCSDRVIYILMIIMHVNMLYFQVQFVLPQRKKVYGTLQGNRNIISRLIPRVHLLLARWTQVRMLTSSDMFWFLRAKTLCLFVLIGCIILLPQIIKMRSVRMKVKRRDLSC